MSQEKTQEELQQRTTPPTFEDSKGNVWTLNLTVGLAEKIVERTQVDLLDENPMAVVLDLIYDYRMLTKVLWEFVEVRATELGIDRGQFIEGLDSDALSEGWSAISEAVIFFTPPHARAGIRATWEKQMEAMERGTQTLVDQVKNPHTDRQIERAMEKMKKDLQGHLEKSVSD